MRKHSWLVPTLALLAALVLAAAGLCLIQVCSIARQPLTILMYHHIVPDGTQLNAMTVTAQQFAGDMRWLKEAGYTTVLPRELAAGDPLPEKAVLVTFDDGYASNYQYAFPVLQQLEMKAAIAVVGRCVEESDGSFYLTWDMCREMSLSGLVEIGAHSYDLHNLDQRHGLFVPEGPNGIQRLEGETEADCLRRVSEDLERNVRDIEAAVGAPVCYLAYPFGVTEPWAESYIRDRFSLTVTTREGRCDPAEGLYQLPRLGVTAQRTAQDCFSLKSNISLFIKEFSS
ncbi:polysaccharide deacetylase family protein [uncultured Flavonifractor sp.]|uniref:polysaccharide deacetylase family protein n=1 Tax=uncultured Flavonifractor sp. TaxID=1193534 RepID=UPI0026206A8C|nr:polysaccharide deacetylase family protein [uncultured Flavonifractor sp.]